MFTTERRSKIMEILKSQGRATVEELSLVVGVSQVTIRKDLAALEEDMLIERTFGGAIYIDSIEKEKPYELKETIQIDEKKRIAKEAVKLLKDGQIVILDSGTSTYQMCEYMSDMRLTVITYDLKIALHLSAYAKVEVIFVGGLVSKNSKSCVGSETCEQLKKYHADYSFIGIDSFSLEEGVGATSQERAHIKKIVRSASTSSVILGASSKYQKKSLMKFDSLDSYDLLIVDNENELLNEDLKASDINYILV